MPKDMMPYMKPNGSSYKPPSGNAGSEGKGAYSYPKNPRSVPKKGSSIKGYSEYGMNADKSKVKNLQSEQETAENLRGIGC